jgi:hypothetical protein
MTPYRILGCLLAFCLLFQAVIAFGVTAEDGDHPTPAVATTSAPTLTDDEAAALTRRAYSHYYNMDYAGALRLYEQVMAARPNDANAVNHVLSTVMFREFNRAGALNTTAYASDSFLDYKKGIKVDARTRSRVADLRDRALKLEEKRLKTDPNDVNALYTRGVTRGLQATWLALIDHSWFGALRAANAARHDHERVLELSPSATDAKFIVGMQTYIAGTLPWAVKMAAAIAGLSGNRERGLKMLSEAAEAHGETSTDAKVALALFLRREQRYEDALKVVRSLSQAYARNYLFALEEANLLKDWGKGEQAMVEYEKILATAAHGGYTESHLEFAEYQLAEILRGRHDYIAAAHAYEAAMSAHDADPQIRQRCALAAGEMHDLLNDRKSAVQDYQIVITADSTSPSADLARKRLKQPYRIN